MQQDLFNREPDPWELDDTSERLVAQVVFAEAPFGPFDYAVPDALRPLVELGRRVRVPLGRGDRPMTAYVVRLENRMARSDRLKEIQSVLDDAALVGPPMLRLTEWMADYYLCPLGQVLEGVVPASVRGQAGTRERMFLSVPTNVAARMTQLKLPPKQAHILKVLAGSPRPMLMPELMLAAGCTAGPIKQLREKKLVVEQSKRVNTTELAQTVEDREAHLDLNEDQQQALRTILAMVDSGQHHTALMHGVTGSGKTEVYIRAIEHVISFGRQAIVLVPEISLTPQTVKRFRSRFDRVAVLHSHLSPADRHWQWRRIVDREVDVIVGARSAVFAPTPQLGLIVIDEEHDGSFKQDSPPRYHAREVARRRAQMESVPLVLGSATPSLESWLAAQRGEYQLVDMPRRVSQRPLPHVGTVDLRDEFHSRQTRGAIARPLHQAIHQTLKEDGQVILLLNRRGFATAIQCPACGHVVKCPDCDLALTHHHVGEKAVCHYCDYEIKAPDKCPDCGFDGIRYSGLGTQKLEAEVRARFPNVSCLRMDSDTMQKPGSHEEALAKFRRGEVKILLGTQMIAKGLDFPNVTLVGVINADTALHFPDFRASERTFQLVTQVAGRTGRGDKGGRVLVQTFSPDHPAIIAALKHDYLTFAAGELPTREEFGYPPYMSLIRLIFRGGSETLTEQFAHSIADRLMELRDQDASATTGDLSASNTSNPGSDNLTDEFESVRILGPAPAPIAKLRGKFRFHILMLGPDGAQLRRFVRQATENAKTPNDTLWAVDVDPSDLL